MLEQSKVIIFYFVNRFKRSEAVYFDFPRNYFVRADWQLCFPPTVQRKMCEFWGNMFWQLYCVSGFWILSRGSKSINSFSKQALATVIVWDYPRLSRKKITILKSLPVVRLTFKFLAAGLKTTTLVPTRKSIKHRHRPCVCIFRENVSLIVRFKKPKKVLKVWNINIVSLGNTCERTNISSTTKSSL